MAEGARGSRVERKRLEVGFGLLKMCLACGPLFIRSGDERADAQFGEGDRGDERLIGEERRILDARQENDRARVEDAARVP